ncbi:MAG: hypothetical protein IH848_11095, partial [Acidobacteria bacterium]|nr:hypothetical protein [Acidobacteriota bacterium]
MLLALALSLAAGATLYWVAGSVGRNVKAARVGACVVALLLFGVLVAPRKAPLEERGADWRPEIKPVSGYTGSSACASCHPGEHATWKASYHRTMTQLATPESVIPPFDGRTLAWGPRKTVLERRGDEYWVQLYDYARPDPIEGEWRRIVMTTGSHTVQHYWAQTGHARIIERMPVAYYIPQERWIPLEAAFIQPPDSFIPLGGWNDNCLACHSTNPRPHVEELNTQVSELGIACEACHGPGAEHVDRYRAAPLARYTRYLTDGDDDQMRVLLQHDANGFIEVHNAIGEHAGVEIAAEVVLLGLTAVDQYLHAVDFEPVGRLYVDLEVDESLADDARSDGQAVGGGHFQERAVGDHHASGLGVADELGRVDLGGGIGRTGNVGAPVADAAAEDAMGVADGDTPDMASLVEHLQPAERAVRPAASADALVCGTEVENLGAPDLGGVDQFFETRKTSVVDAVLVAVKEDAADRRMIGLHPAVGAATKEGDLGSGVGSGVVAGAGVEGRRAPIPQHDGVDARVVIPQRGAPVLRQRVGPQGEGVAVLSA